MSARVRVAIQELVAAMESLPPDVDAYLDRRTGEVLVAGDPVVTGEEMGEVGERVDADPERYVWIEPIRSSRAWRIMADFVDSLADADPRRTLARALRRRKPFQSFRLTLEDFPGIREEWYRFKDAAYRQLAEDFLELEEIEAELVEG